ncbi:hypothetical protein [Algoriphagus sediminis]|uniref:Uncharacterized protein n=1 Tax=Algoriphagus sediminis TaxID=3057113 RepID=A0ABT7YF75_9BACT|nr:hypothetical protein [Algoriphagus sediminis]MDN3205152.1 hypothetical protein [Algoriphagus sediminis]
MRYLFTSALLFISIFSFSQNIPSKDVQIKTAILAAPEAQRAEAKVYGYSSSGDFITLREGTNEVICIADEPGNSGFSVACYHISAEPFMARGRELKKEGKGFQEVFDTREAEAKAGTLKLPDSGSLLNVMTAKLEDVNWTTREVANSYTRSVVYIPWATSESTGLPTGPAGPGLPWIMDPGTHRAHIMINPAKD